MSLKEYKKKRSFPATPEPSVSGKTKNDRILRFVVQKHRARQLHYDFRLEWGGVLKSWAVPKGPPRRAGYKRLAVMTEDHPFAYKNFHGRIPKGQYGAGTVDIWDTGTYRPASSVPAGLRRGHLAFVLRGEKLYGEYGLVKFRGPKNWLLLKARSKK